MDVSCDDRYHCKQVLGFFVQRNGKLKSPQFSIVSNITQNGYIVVAPIGDYDLGIRLALVHQDMGRSRGRVIGFTSERNKKLEYFFSGVIPFGKILVIPVEDQDRIQKRRPDYPFEDYVNVFEEVDGSLRYTRIAEDALEFLFEILDTDNNGFLSALEMTVFKEFLGLGKSITEEEWSDILFGWQDGDLDFTLTEISSSFFKTFVIRLCEGTFSFVEPWTLQQDTPYPMTNRARRIKNLELIFECFGFDKDLVPGISRYRFEPPDICNIYVRNPLTRPDNFSIRFYTERNSMSSFTVIPRSKVESERVIRSVTRVFGKKKNSKFGVTLYILKCDDWFSLLVKNNNEEQKEVVIEYHIVTCNRGIHITKPGFSLRKIIPGDSETVMPFLHHVNMGSVALNSIPQPHPCKILHGPFQHVQLWHLQNLHAERHYPGEAVRTLPFTAM